MRRRTTMIAVVAAVALLSGACAGSKDKASSSTTAAPAPGKKIKVGKPETSDVTFAVFLTGSSALTVYGAQKLGYFKDAGLNVKFKNVGLPTNIIPALSGGQADLAFAGYETVFNAINGGVDLKLLREMASNVKGGLELWASPQSGIHSAADLKGKTVGVPGIGGFPDYLLSEALATKGMTLKDVKLKEVPPPLAVPQMEKGDLDAAWLPAEFATALAIDPKTKLVRAIDFHSVPALEHVGIGAMIAKSDFTAKNPNTTRLFVKAVDKAAAAMAADRSLADAVAKQYTKLDPAVIKALPTIPYTGKVPVAKIEHQQKRYVELGIQQKLVDLSSVIFPID